MNRYEHIAVFPNGRRERITKGVWGWWCDCYSDDTTTLNELKTLIEADGGTVKRKQNKDWEPNTEETP